MDNLLEKITFISSNQSKIMEAEKILQIPISQNGVEAAYNAGMKVFALPHEHSQQHDFSKATTILHSMLDIDEDMIRSL